MQFLFPWFLAALGTLAIPIIIHLFYFKRYKKVYFSSVRFLKEVKDETSARSKLKNLLVLIARLAALALLVMAFAQPFIRTSAQEKYAQNQVGIFVDNSYSMNALSQDIPLISQAKQRARTIIESYSNQDRFMVLTHDFDGRYMRMVHQEEAITLIDEIQPTASVHTLNEAYQRIRSTILKFEGNHPMYLISDFQRSIMDLPNLPDTLVKSFLIPLQSVQERNVAIDSAWFESPAQWIGQPNLLKFKIRNYGDQAIQEARISVIQNNQSKPLGTINLAAGESKIDTAQIIIDRAGWQDVQLEITDFPVQFDDKLFLTFNVNARLNVLVISPSVANDHLLTALQSLPSTIVAHQSLKNVNYTSFAQYQLIILDDINDISSGLANELITVLGQGTNVLLFPGPTADIKSLSDFANQAGAGSYVKFEKKNITVSSINTHEFTFKDVYSKVSSNMRLPSTQGRYIRNKGSKGEENILTFPDEVPFLSKIKVDNNALYIFSSPLQSEWSDLSRNPEIFIPMIFRMALNKNKSDKIMRTIGQDEVIELNQYGRSSEDIIHLKSKSGDDLIPQQRTLGTRTVVDLSQSIKAAGNYTLSLKDSIIGKVAFNFNRKESDLSTLAEDQIKTIYGSNFEVIEQRDTAAFDAWFKNKQNGQSYWKWFIGGTLFFLLIESLLLRFWKI
ncbi:MAG: BatA and WFA domain-containing protein [Saprospiraceae bacterium]